MTDSNALRDSLAARIDAAAKRAGAMDRTVGDPSQAAQKHSQHHLLHFWDELASEQQQSLALQIQEIFPHPNEKLPEGFADASTIFWESLTASTTPPATVLPPLATDICYQHKHQQDLVTCGAELLANGRGAVIILAGGSGTRLGVSFPKGQLVCPDLVEPKSLFQLHCEKIRRAELSFAAGKEIRIPLCYMTSPQTDSATRQFFKENNFFGLQPSQVHFFMQSTMPCFTHTGKILLADSHTIAEAPGGNAGLYAALGNSGLLLLLRDQGVDYVQVATVDNLLTVLPDTALFGCALVAETQKHKTTGREHITLDVAVKTVPKLHDHEAVGVFAKRTFPEMACNLSGLVWGVVEYTEIGKALAEKVDPETGTRCFNAANIAIHLMSVPFLMASAERMKTFAYYHIAKKPISVGLGEQTIRKIYGDETAEKSTETSVQGIKLEAFIFDLFQFASQNEGFLVVECSRDEEFSAIKNADVPGSPQAGTQEIKKDSPQSAVRDLRNLHRKWLLQAAAECGVNIDSAKLAQVEISPLVATSVAELKSLLAAMGSLVKATCEAAPPSSVITFEVSKEGEKQVVLKCHEGRRL